MKGKSYYLPIIHDSKLSLYPYFRLGGFGLGNMLFPFFRSLLASIKEGAILMYPHHFQIQPRNFLRNFDINSLRNYSSDFSKFSWCTLPKLRSAYIFYNNSWKEESLNSNDLYIYFSGYKNYFYDFFESQSKIQKFTYFSFSFKPILKKGIVAFHLRLGDFIINNQSIEKNKVIDTFEFFLRKSMIIHIYSDASKYKILQYLQIEELPHNVFLIKSKTPMNDILMMSQAEIICGSPHSTFVEWAKFLRPVEFPNNSFSLIEKKQAESVNISPIKWKNFF